MSMRNPILRITRNANGEVVFEVSGRLTAENVAEMEALLAAETTGRRIVLDCTDLRSVDAEAVKFLEKWEADSIQLKNCGLYIREWIRRERLERKSGKNSDIGNGRVPFDLSTATQSAYKRELDAGWGKPADNGLSGVLHTEKRSSTACRLQSPSRPIGPLFLGPTGSGKTRICSTRFGSARCAGPQPPTPSASAPSFLFVRQPRKALLRLSRLRFTFTLQGLDLIVKSLA